MRTVLFCSILSISLTGCVQKTIPTCMQEQNVTTCDQLFDAMQANMDNPTELMKLQECYKQNCQ